MSTEYKLTKIEQVVEVGTTLPRSWFRGHPKAYGNLTPKLYRKQFNYMRPRENFELSLIESFKRGAPVLEHSIPDEEDHIGWLFLMQHHGLPTRLLDWTKSILVALYFVVDKYPSENGELWAMYPEALNKRSGFHGIPLRNYKGLLYYAMEPWYSRDKLIKELGLEKAPNYPLAVAPPMNFTRMMAQLSEFTIHPAPQQGDSILELLPNKKHLVRYMIPASKKEGLQWDLSALGITRRTLFPDLDALSEDIIYEHKVVAYTPPEPPKFDC
jgi:hypothetical protein